MELIPLHKKNIVFQETLLHMVNLINLITYIFFIDGSSNDNKMGLIHCREHRIIKTILKQSIRNLGFDTITYKSNKFILFFFRWHLGTCIIQK